MYTPGPWTYAKDSCGKYSKEGECGGGYYIREVPANGHGFEKEADARLIASAPELLEALRNARACCDYQYDLQIVKILDAAILKAVGNK